MLPYSRHGGAPWWRLQRTWCALEQSRAEQTHRGNGIFRAAEGVRAVFPASRNRIRTYGEEAWEWGFSKITHLRRRMVKGVIR